MERSEILAGMGELKLYGMKAAFDQIVTTAVKRQHEPQQVIGDFVGAEIAEKQARSIKYQITASKLRSLPSAHCMPVVVKRTGGVMETSTPRRRASTTGGTMTMSPKPPCGRSGPRPSC